MLRKIEVIESWTPGDSWVPWHDAPVWFQTEHISEISVEKEGWTVFTMLSGTKYVVKVSVEYFIDNYIPG